MQTPHATRNKDEIAHFAMPPEHFVVKGGDELRTHALLSRQGIQHFPKYCSSDRLVTKPRSRKERRTLA